MLTLGEVKKKVNEALEDGPGLGRSQFQLQHFVASNCEGAEGSARAYRQVLLELREKFIALEKYQISLRKMTAQRNLLVKRMEASKDEDRRTIVECEIEEKDIDMDTSRKLVADAIQECNWLYSTLQSMPAFTREQFEKEEKGYWTKRFLLEAQVSLLANGTIDTGTAKSLLSLGVNPIEAKLTLAQDNQQQVTKLLQKKAEVPSA